jgi:hypothetical protein
MAGKRPSESLQSDTQLTTQFCHLQGADLVDWSFNPQPYDNNATRGSATDLSRTGSGTGICSPTHDDHINLSGHHFGHNIAIPRSIDFQLSDHVDLSSTCLPMYEPEAGTNPFTNANPSVPAIEPGADHSKPLDHYSHHINDPSLSFWLNDGSERTSLSQSGSMLPGSISTFNDTYAGFQDVSSHYNFVDPIHSLGLGAEVDLLSNNFQEQLPVMEQFWQQDSATSLVSMQHITGYHLPSTEFNGLPISQQTSTVRVVADLQSPLALERIKDEGSNTCGSANGHTNTKSVQVRPLTIREKPQQGLVRQSMNTPIRSGRVLKVRRKLPPGVPSSQVIIWNANTEAEPQKPSWKRSAGPCFLCQMSRKRVSLPINSLWNPPKPHA